MSTCTAHRVSPGWEYGFAELEPAQRNAVANADRVANPGCYPTGAIALIRPLVNTAAFHTGRDLDVAIAASEESLRLATTVGNRPFANLAASNLIVSLWNAGRWAELRARLDDEAIVVDAIVPALLVAGGLLAIRAPFLIVVAAAAAVAALLRLWGWAA